MVVPILCNRSEIRDFHKTPSIERVYMKFLKQVFGDKQEIYNGAVYCKFEPSET